MAFAGPMGPSAARWGMELDPMNERQREAKMWIEVARGGLMRAIPAAHHLPVLPRARLPPAGTTRPGRASTRPAPG
jgi:hypothetical protein